MIISLVLVVTVVATIFITGFIEDLIRKKITKKYFPYFLKVASDSTKIPSSCFNCYWDGYQPVVYMYCEDVDYVQRFKGYIDNLYDMRKFSVRLHLLLGYLHLIIYILLGIAPAVIISIYCFVIDSFIPALFLPLISIAVGIEHHIYRAVVVFITGLHPEENRLMYRYNNQ